MGRKGCRKRQGTREFRREKKVGLYCIIAHVLKYSSLVMLLLCVMEIQLCRMVRKRITINKQHHHTICAFVISRPFRELLSKMSNCDLLSLSKCKPHILPLFFSNVSILAMNPNHYYSADKYYYDVLK